MLRWAAEHSYVVGSGPSPKPDQADAEKGQA
jgi:hypothetical protein